MPTRTGEDCSVEQCPYGCRGHGECVNLKCECSGEWAGPDCGTRTCPNDCNNAGWCVEGKCECFPGVKVGKDGECNIQSLYRDMEASCAVDCVNKCMAECSPDSTGEDIKGQVKCLDDCSSSCIDSCGGQD